MFISSLCPTYIYHTAIFQDTLDKPFATTFCSKIAKVNVYLRIAKLYSDLPKVALPTSQTRCLYMPKGVLLLNKHRVYMWQSPCLYVPTTAFLLAKGNVRGGRERVTRYCPSPEGVIALRSVTR